MVRRLEQLLRPPARGSMLPDFVLDQASLLARRQREARARGELPEPERIREALIRSLGTDRIPSAEARTWLDEVEGPGYRIRKLVFETAPGLPVPALLYLPDGAGPHPAVVHPPGHWMEDGKLAAPLQLMNLRLVRDGIAVLCYDTVGQGERRVGWHQHGQLAPVLTGFTTLGLMVAETRTALGILEGLPEVDPSRLGVVGASGGGFSSIFAAVLDPRIRVAAISSIVNTHLGQLGDAAFGTGWDGWVDLCNQVPRLCAIGTMGEILACVAPRQLLVANATDDPPFPLAGAREVATEVREILGEQDLSFAYVEVPGGHGFASAAMREVVAGHLVRQLAGRAATTLPDGRPDFDPQWPNPHNLGSARRPQDMSPRPSSGTCLPSSVDANLPLVELARQRAAALRTTRPPADAGSLRAFLGLDPQDRPPPVRVRRHLPIEGGFAQHLELDSEPGIVLDALLLLPENWTDALAPIVVILDEGGKQAALDLPATALARERGWAVLLPDLRGTGESDASEFEIATAAWMLDRDLLSQRVGDVGRLVDYLSARYSSAQQLDKGIIILAGAGAFGLVALLAATLDDRVAGVVVEGLRSLEDLLVPSPRETTPMAYRHGLLEIADVPDLIRLLESRPAELADHPAGCCAALESVLARLTSSRSGGTRPPTPERPRRTP